MDFINKLDLYLEYCAFFFQNYLLWAVIAIAALIFIIKKYNKAHPTDKQKWKIYVYLISIAIVILLVFFIINSVKHVDTSHKKTNQFSELSY